MNAETFWTQVGSFNQATLPIQVILIIVAVILTYLTFTKPSVKTDIWMKAFLALAFAWNGIVFFLIFAKNPISTFFGAPLFIILAILFAVDIFAKKIEFKLPDIKWRKWMTNFIFSLVLFQRLVKSLGINTSPISLIDQPKSYNAPTLELYR